MAPAFLGFFSKRDNTTSSRKSSDPSLQSRPTAPAGIPHASSNRSIPSPSSTGPSELLESSELSLEAEYVLADANSPTLTTSSVYPSASSSSPPANTSTTKLRIPFRKKQSIPNKLTTATSQNSLPPILPPVLPLPPNEHNKFSLESTVSSLLPPPSRSAIFASYADPHSALSTRSLPQDVPLIHSRRISGDTSQDYETMSNPDIHAASLPAPQSKQPNKGGLFSLARPRGRTKSKAAIPDPSLRSAPVLTLPPTDSFNLRAFRHVTSPSSENPPSNTPLNKSPQPRPPRPRGDSVASDSSQRISVAAFREAARRSAADSPVPSLPGDRDSFISGQVRIRKLSSTLGTPPAVSTAGAQPRPPATRSPPPRSSTVPLSFAASTTSSESSEEGESESEQEATLRPCRKRTVTSRSVHSELGHRPSPISSPISSFSATRSDIGHGLSSGLTTRPSPAPRNARNSPSLEASGSGSRTSSVYSRPRASVSTSALASDAAAKQVSVITKSPIGPFLFLFIYLVPVQTSLSASRP